PQSAVIKTRDDGPIMMFAPSKRRLSTEPGASTKIYTHLHHGRRAVNRFQCASSFDVRARAASSIRARTGEKLRSNCDRTRGATQQHTCCATSPRDFAA